jgi:hypothetical protein
MYLFTFGWSLNYVIFNWPLCDAFHVTFNFQFMQSIDFFMFYDQMAFHNDEFEPNSLTFNLSCASNDCFNACCIKNNIFLGVKNHKRHYNKSEYYVTIYFLFNKKVDKFLPFLCFGKSSFQFAKILVLILLNFLKQNDWIFNNSHNISLNNLKPPLYTHLHKRLSNNTNWAMGGTWLGGFQHDKQSKLPFQMDRFFYCHLFHIIFMSLLVMVLSFCGSMLFNLFAILWCHQRLDHPQQVRQI